MYGVQMLQGNNGIFYAHPGKSGPEVIKIFMLNSAEHEIYFAYKS